MPSYDIKYSRTKDGYRKTVRRRHPILFWVVAFPLALSVVLSHAWTGIALIAVLLLCAYANLKDKRKSPDKTRREGRPQTPVSISSRSSSGDTLGLKGTDPPFSSDCGSTSPPVAQPRRPTAAEAQHPMPSRLTAQNIQGRSSMTRERFIHAIDARFKVASDAGDTYIDVTSGDVHRSVGGYPGNNHRMPLCCSVMYQLMRPGDEVLAKPPKGQGATLRIRYCLPR
jgi:hypothetical protein